MVDPQNITNYYLNDHELEEHILFWICVAGKTAKVAAKGLDCFLKRIDGYVKGPFNAVRKKVARYDLGMGTDIAEDLKACGIGCYGAKSETIRQIAFSGYNLRLCTTDQLELIKGIGPKTSRCFILHSRRNARVAGLDTHILKFLRSKGHHEVPTSTPTNRKWYAKFEKMFLKYADEAGMTPAAFDLEVWKRYAK